VTAIIDGMGSIGAALGPMLTGYISESGGFDMVFAMLYTAALLAGLLLVRLASRELAELRGRPGPPLRGGGFARGGSGSFSPGSLQLSVAGLKA